MGNQLRNPRRPPSPNVVLLLPLGVEPLPPFTDPDHLLAWIPARHPGRRGSLAFGPHPAVHGTVWSENRTGPADTIWRFRGFGLHTAREVFRLANPAWILVHADSGLWLLEAETLAKRARLETRRVEAADVSIAGDRLVYAECDTGPSDPAAAEVRSRCEIVVRRLSSFLEVRREPVEPPRSVHLSVGGDRVAIAGHRVLVMPTSQDGGDSWSTPVDALRDPIDALPIGDRRGAYVTTTGLVVVWAHGEERSLAAIPGNPDSNGIGFGADVRGAAAKTLVYAPATDRLLLPADGRVIEGAGRASADVHPALRETATVSLPPFHTFANAMLTRDVLASDLGLGDLRPWGIDKMGSIDTVQGGATFGVIDGRVIRIDRNGVDLSLDFDGMGTLRTSRSRFDDVIWTSDGRTNDHAAGQLALWRMRLDRDLIDTPVEALTTDRPVAALLTSALIFDNGDRAFVFDSQIEIEDVEVRRLPRNGSALGPSAETLPPSQIHGPFVRGDDGWARVQGGASDPGIDSGRLVFISQGTVSVLDEHVPFGGELSWSSEKRCWSITDDNHAHPHWVCREGAPPKEKPSRKAGP